MVLSLVEIFRTYIYNNKTSKITMSNGQIEMKQLYGKLKQNIPTTSQYIYLSDGLYLHENGDISEDYL